MSIDVISLIIGIVDLILIGIVLGWVNRRAADKDAAETLRLITLALRGFEQAGLAEYNRDGSGRIVGMVVKMKASIGGKANATGTLTVKKIDD